MSRHILPTAISTHYHFSATSFLQWLLPPGEEMTNATGVLEQEPPAWFEVRRPLVADVGKLLLEAALSCRLTVSCNMLTVLFSFLTG